jgi:hypothetical protein
MVLPLVSWWWWSCCFCLAENAKKQPSPSVVTAGGGWRRERHHLNSRMSLSLSQPCLPTYHRVLAHLLAHRPANNKGEKTIN